MKAATAVNSERYLLHTQPAGSRFEALEIETQLPLGLFLFSIGIVVRAMYRAGTIGKWFEAKFPAAPTTQLNSAFVRNLSTLRP
jgi:hypothetical protein